MTRAATPNNRANSGMIGVRPGGASTHAGTTCKTPIDITDRKGPPLPSIFARLPDRTPWAR